MKTIEITNNLDIIPSILYTWKQCEAKKIKETIVCKVYSDVGISWPDIKNINNKTIKILAEELKRTNQYLQIELEVV